MAQPDFSYQVQIVGPNGTTVVDFATFLAVPASASRGEVAGSVTAGQLPSVAGTHARLKARGNNTGNIYYDDANTVTRPDGTTDTTTGMEILPGDAAFVSLTANLNELWHITDNAGDAFLYEVW